MPSAKPFVDREKVVEAGPKVLGALSPINILSPRLTVGALMANKLLFIGQGLHPFFGNRLRFDAELCDKTHAAFGGPKVQSFAPSAASIAARSRDETVEVTVTRTLNKSCDFLMTWLAKSGHVFDFTSNWCEIDFVILTSLSAKQPRFPLSAMAALSDLKARAKAMKNVRT